MRRPEGLLSALFLIAAGVATGCGPGRYLANTPGVAAKEVAQAEKLDAARHAPYETTAAREYLHKARELAGHARYQEAVRYAREATRLAKAAQALAKEKAGDSVDVDVTDMPESPPAQQQPTTQPKAPAQPEPPSQPPARPKASPRHRDGHR
jgi:hypothetical protein